MTESLKDTFFVLTVIGLNVLCLAIYVTLIIAYNSQGSLSLVG